MKRVLLLSLGLLIGMAGFAQVKINQGDYAKKSHVTNVKTFDGTEVSPAANYAPSAVLPSVTTTQIRGGEATLMPTMVTEYDLQSNSAIGNRIAVWPDGAVAVAATWDGGENGQWNDRGAGYNFYDGSAFGEEPTARQEPIKSGWPSICAYGNGELLTSHNANGVTIYKRATRGEGDWEELYTFNTDNVGYDATWARVGATEDGTIHIVFAEQYTDEESHNVSEIAYFRSTDGGQTWVENPAINALSTEYNKLISADDYVMAINGNRVAIACFSMTYDLFYMFSEDAGVTWTKNIVCEHPYKAHLGVNFNWGQTEVADLDTIRWNDNSGSIAIGNNGVVHMTWALGRWHPAPSSGWGYYSSYYFTPGMVYWNSNYTNEQGTHVIPNVGDFSGDAEHMAEWSFGAVLGADDYVLDYVRVQELEEAEGNGNLHWFGIVSELNPNSEDGWYPEEDFRDNVWGAYRTFDGYDTMPSVAVDNGNSVYILYSGLSDKRTGTSSEGATYFYRSPFLHTCVDGVWQNWYEATTVATGVAHNVEEAYSITAYPNEVNGEMWFLYSADDGMGLFLDGDQTEVTENTLYAVKIAKLDAVSEVRDVVYNIYPNPASDYICIAADANADATITFVNLAGQTVKTINTNLTIGQNSISIDLASGVYFCTVNANGFSKTTKVVVK